MPVRPRSPCGRHTRLGCMRPLASHPVALLTPTHGDRASGLWSPQSFPICPLSPDPELPLGLPHEIAATIALPDRSARPGRPCNNESENSLSILGFQAVSHPLSVNR